MKVPADLLAVNPVGLAVVTDNGGKALVEPGGKDWNLHGDGVVAQQAWQLGANAGLNTVILDSGKKTLWGRSQNSY